MTQKRIIAAVICTLAGCTLLWAATIGWQDFSLQTSIPTPPANSSRIGYVGSGLTGLFGCTRSDGSSCMPATGGTGVTGPTGPTGPAGGGGGSSYTILATSFVITRETTTSSTYADLTTPDTVSATCSATCNLLMEYLAGMGVSSSGPQFCGNLPYLDTVAVEPVNTQGSTFGFSFPDGNSGSNAQWKATGLAAGSHTFTVKHSSLLGTACGWYDRLIKISLVP